MVKRIKNLFLLMVHRIESDPTPVGRYFLLFVAILALRLTLEFFSSHRLFGLADVLHIGLWFAMIVQAFLLQLHWFSGASIAKVTRLSVVGFSIALTAPVIDLLISGGLGAKMNYLAINSWQDVAWAYITAGGSSLSRGATLGIRIEIALLVFASATYIYQKRKAWLPALLGALSIYTVLFVSGTVPKLLGLIVDGFGLQYGPGDQSTVLLLLTANLFLLFGGCWRHAPLWMKATLSRLPYGLMLLGGALGTLGALHARASYPDNWSLSPTSLFHFPLLFAVTLSLGTLIHVLRQAKAETRLRNGLAILLLILGLSISDRVLFGVAGLWGLLFLYAEAPLFLGRILLLRQLLLAAGMAVCALTGFMLLGGPMVGFPKATLLVLIASAFLISLGLDTPAPSAPTIPWWQAPARLPRIVRHLAFGLGLVLPIAYLNFTKGPGDVLPPTIAVLFVALAHFSGRLPMQILLALLACAGALFGIALTAA